MDWSTFAEKIGLATEQVDAIRSNHQIPLAEQKRRKAIDDWFDMSRPLEDFVCGLRGLKHYRDADKLVKKYCKGYANSADLCKT